MMPFLCHSESVSVNSAETGAGCSGVSRRGLQSHPPVTGVLKWEILESAPGSAPEGAPGNRGALGGAPESAQGDWGCSKECSRECSMWGVNAPH